MQSAIGRIVVSVLLAISSPGVPIWAQSSGYVSEYIVSRTATLTAAAEAVTVQLPAASSRFVRFGKAQIWCSTGSVDVTISRDGSAATTTSATVGKQSPNATWMSNSLAQAFHTSNVGAGTQIGSTQTVYGSSTGLVLDLSSFVLEKNSASVQNLTIRTASYTGTVRIQISWEERPNL